MWLLNIDTRTLKAFEGRPPPYVILSHRWQEDEVTFQDIFSGVAGRRSGYSKLNGFCKKVKEEFKSHYELVEYVWIDTCCIDKSNSSELSEAINSMYKWYEEATECYVYLSDIAILADGSFELESSTWFTRGWTLQELLAPSAVLFFDRDWKLLGTRRGLGPRISEITSIAPSALNQHYQNFSPSDHSVAERMSWASKRRTTRDEDMAYSLLGIFEVNMPLIYGEGKRAFYRLQEEILRTSEDLTIFAWEGFGRRDFEILAESPASYHRERGKPALKPYRNPMARKAFNALGTHGITITSAGISINLPLVPIFLDTYLVAVATDENVRCICITRNRGDGFFRKALIDGKNLATVSQRAYEGIQMRRVVLGRGSMIALGLTLDESYYKFEFEEIAPEIVHDLQRLLKAEDNSYNFNSVSRPIEIMSRFDSDSDPTSLIMHAGFSGVAGMVRFALLDRTWVFFLFGHDFDYNPFCLAVRAATPILHEQSIASTEITGPMPRTYPYLLDSHDDLAELTSAMRHGSRKSWSLKKEGAELHEMPWTDGPDWTFAVCDSVQVNVSRYMSDTVYMVKIGQKAGPGPTWRAYAKVEKWHVHSWDG